MELERAVQEGVDAVSEVAAVGIPTPGGGPERLVLFVVPRGAGQEQGGGEAAAALVRACQAAITSRLNPLFKVGGSAHCVHLHVWVSPRWELSLWRCQCHWHCFPFSR